MDVENPVTALDAVMVTSTVLVTEMMVVTVDSCLFITTLTFASPGFSEYVHGMGSNLGANGVDGSSSSSSFHTSLLNNDEK